MSARRFGILVGAAAAAAVGASALADPPAVMGEKGLGLTGRATPDALRQAAADPYAMPPPPVCQNADQELSQLTQILGPDVDAPPAKTNRIGDLAGGAVRHFVPYRGWLRFVTGADRKDKAFEKASKAGWERRGYLKGLLRQYDCLHQGEAVIAAAEDAATDVAANTSTVVPASAIDDTHPAADPADAPPDQAPPTPAPAPGIPPAPAEPAPNG